MNVRYLWSLSVCLSVAFVFGSGSNLAAENATQSSTLNVLFIGNSYTARHNLPQVVKAMAEAGNPKLTFNATSVIYGGGDWSTIGGWGLRTSSSFML